MHYQTQEQKLIPFLHDTPHSKHGQCLKIADYMWLHSLRLDNAETSVWLWILFVLYSGWRRKEASITMEYRVYGFINSAGITRPTLQKIKAVRILQYKGILSATVCRMTRAHWVYRTGDDVLCWFRSWWLQFIEKRSWSECDRLYGSCLQISGLQTVEVANYIRECENFVVFW